MNDPTPARPELPTLPKPSEKGWIYETKQMKAYGRQCADEREAWARADERRKALEEAIQMIRDEKAVNVSSVAIRMMLRDLIDLKEPT